MENSNLLKVKLIEMENLIVESCMQQENISDYSPIHQSVIQNHYNATDVAIDYHRRRVVLSLVVDDANYDYNKLNTNIPTLHVNLRYRNLETFLKSCLDTDTKSLLFYANLLRSNTIKSRSLMTA